MITLKNLIIKLRLDSPRETKKGKEGSTFYKVLINCHAAYCSSIYSAVNDV